MAYHRTIFRQMVELNSRLEFQNIVNQRNGDYRTRALKCWDQFIYLLSVQLGNRNSFRDTIQ